MVVSEVIKDAKDGELFVDAQGTKWRVAHRPGGRELAVHHADLAKRQGWLSHWTTGLVEIPGLRSLKILERPSTKKGQG